MSQPQESDAYQRPARAKRLLGAVLLAVVCLLALGQVLSWS